VAALVGPRQSGKTTLARAVVPAGSPAYFDLEDPLDLARASLRTALGSTAADGSGLPREVSGILDRCRGWIV
jgi:hypothetical protein